MGTVVFFYRASWVVTLRNRRTPPRPQRLAGPTSECISRTLVRRLRPSRRCLCPGLHVTSRTILFRRKSSPSGGSRYFSGSVARQVCRVLASPLEERRVKRRV